MGESDLCPNGWQNSTLFRPRDFLAAALGAVSFSRTNEYFYSAIFRAAGRRYALSPALLRAMGAVLSGQKADFLSPGGKMGIMQLSPDIARFLKLQNPFDPVENIFGAARYLRLLLNGYGGDFCVALAAYYAGEEPGQKTQAPSLSREAEEFVTRVLTLAAVEAGRQREQPKGKIFAELARLFKNGSDS